ncbi:hypothetical protein Q7P37_002509 [Cladosporium fusiforme]
MTTDNGLPVVRLASSADVDSMATMIPRSYPPDSSLSRLISDTPSVRRWWTETYKAALEDPACCLLVAVEGIKTVGLLTMHYLDSASTPQDGNGGIATAIPLTSDHSQDMAAALQSLGQERRNWMGDEAHFIIELVAVDCAYQNLGIGRRLATRACEIADKMDAAIFLHTTSAVHFYTKRLDLGFYVKQHDVSNEAGGIVIRPSRSRR